MFYSIYTYIFQWIKETTHFGFCFLGLVSQKNEVNIMVKNAVDVIYGGLSYWLYGFAFSFGVAEGTNGFTGIGEMMETFWWLCVFDWSCWGKKNKIKEMIISKLLTCLNAWMLDKLFVTVNYTRSQTWNQLHLTLTTLSTKNIFN